MVIMNRYTKMYGWLNSAFGDSKFTIDDFNRNFPSSQPPKTIHDLIKLISSAISEKLARDTVIK